ncbi:hypothetical protein N5D48_08750 [Pseudomonas sp. GD03858]|uniref:hypothetical protein n=1 Tax=unclassified Pseudomonas TaxID=196821 RepID=UPI00244B8436|nr:MULTISPECIES: hypothetical protein [unclassified Pseudomonas]MDH0646868.1 hypothetical protein [Pseudomonas sp. GD03867]MDH0662487.1 hypothetical protein [Pseudomonas sp. GD03858]
MSTSRHRGLRYQVYRSQARKLAHAVLCIDQCVSRHGLDADTVCFEPIDHRAFDAFQLWGEQTHHFPWEEVPRWMGRDRKGFDLSLWSARELCGLCYASPRQSRRCIKIILLEGKPGPANPLRGLVASLSLQAVAAYARMLKYSRIEVQQPDPGAEPLYQSLGFVRDRAGSLVIPVAAMSPQSTLHLSEVPMSYSKDSRRAALIKRYTAQAIALAGEITDQQRHFLEVGFKEGREKEPEGILAGPRSGPIDYEWCAAGSK